MFETPQHESPPKPGQQPTSWAYGSFDKDSKVRHSKGSGEKQSSPLKEALAEQRGPFGQVFAPVDQNKLLSEEYF